VGAASSEIGVVESPWLFNYANVPGEPVIAERLEKSHPYADELHLQTNLQAGNRYTIGYTQVYGQGRLTLIGLAPSAQLLLALHRFFNIPIPARAHTPGIATAIFRREEAVYLVAVNYGEESRAVEVELSEDILEKAHLQVSDMVTGKVWEINCNETHSLVFGLPRKDGTVLKLIEKAR
jgi:hypothetical protein